MDPLDRGWVHHLVRPIKTNLVKPSHFEMFLHAVVRPSHHHAWVRLERHLKAPPVLVLWDPGIDVWLYVLPWHELAEKHPHRGPSQAQAGHEVFQLLRWGARMDDPCRAFLGVDKTKTGQDIQYRRGVDGFEPLTYPGVG